MNAENLHTGMQTHKHTYAYKYQESPELCLEFSRVNQALHNNHLDPDYVVCCQKVVCVFPLVWDSGNARMQGLTKPLPNRVWRQCVCFCFLPPFCSPCKFIVLETYTFHFLLLSHCPRCQNDPHLTFEAHIKHSLPNLLLPAQEHCKTPPHNHSP